MDQKINLINKAIDERLALSCTYDSYNRVISPHTFGLGKDGLHMVLVFQNSGGSSSGQLGWKCMVVSRLQDLSIDESNPWETRDNHSEQQTCVKAVLNEVDY